MAAMGNPQRYDNDTGLWVDALPEPYYHSLFSWLWKRLTGWRDEHGRKAYLIYWIW